MPRNPSEIERLTQEQQYLESCVFGENSLKFSKAFKAEKLKELREVEEQLGIEGRSYNGV